MTRPPIFRPEPLTRKFAAYQGGRLVGIAFFDPISPADARPSYVYQIIREAQDAPPGVRTHLLLSVAEQFRNEGVATLSLGMSPLSLPAQEPYRYGRGTRFLLRLIRKLTGAVYNYDGQEFYKSRFGGRQRTVFLCSPCAVAWKEILALLFDTGLVRSGLRSLRRRP